MSIQGKRVLVTGGAGFIGSHLTKKLVSLGAEVTIVDNLNEYYDPKLKEDRIKIFLKGLVFEFIQLDIADFDRLKQVFVKHTFDVVVHLAAQAGVRYSLENPWIYEKTNVLGTLNILELCNDFNIEKLVYASSSSVYGGNTKMPFSEKDSVDQPISLYAATKKTDELMAYTYHHLYGLQTIGLRFFTVYGPWGRPDMALFKFADLMRQGKAIEVYNQGKMKRDFTYIDDIVDGVIASLENEFDYEIFNLGNNHPEQLMTMIEYLEQYLQLSAKKSYLPIQPGDMVATWADIDKAKIMLKFDPKVQLKDGVKKFVDWYIEYYKDKD